MELLVTSGTLHWLLPEGGSLGSDQGSSPSISEVAPSFLLPCLCYPAAFLGVVTTRLLGQLPPDLVPGAWSQASLESALTASLMSWPVSRAGAGKSWGQQGLCRQGVRESDPLGLR